MSDNEPVPVYRFVLVAALLCGWQVHAARQRLIHEQSARHRQRRHHWLGISAVLFTVLAGSSAATMLKDQATHSTGLAYASVLLAAVAAILAGIVTFLDLGSQAERHRIAAAHYKRALRDLEAMAPPGHLKLADLASKPDADLASKPDYAPVTRFIEEMRVRLGDTDAAAPIPPKGIAKKIEKRGVESRLSACADRSLHLRQQESLEPGGSKGDQDVNADSGRGVWEAASRAVRTKAATAGERLVSGQVTMTWLGLRSLTGTTARRAGRRRPDREHLLRRDQHGRWRGSGSIRA